MYNKIADNYGLLTTNSSFRSLIVDGFNIEVVVNLDDLGNLGISFINPVLFSYLCIEYGDRFAVSFRCFLEWLNNNMNLMEIVKDFVCNPVKAENLTDIEVTVNNAMNYLDFTYGVSVSNILVNCLLGEGWIPKKLETSILAAMEKEGIERRQDKCEKS